MSSPSISSVAGRRAAPGGSAGTGAAMPTSIDALATTPPPPLASRHELTVTELLAQAEKIKQAMTRAMEEGIHFGTIPGTPKPTLLKAGAEKLCLLFRMDPEYESHETIDGEHLTVKSKCTLWHVPTGQRLGSGEGLATTRENKYAYRKGPDGARRTNPDLFSLWNVVLKMANKRALVAAVLNVTAASDVMTQDLEDDEPPKPTGSKVRHPETESESEPPIPPSLEPPATLPPPPLRKLFIGWREALTSVPNAQELQARWKRCTAPEVWSQFRSDEQTVLIDLKDLAKRQFGLE
jgi:hypothetical protein